jgi:hypothetical protein
MVADIHVDILLPSFLESTSLDVIFRRQRKTQTCNQLVKFGRYDVLSSGIIVVWNVNRLPYYTPRCTPKLNKEISIGNLNTSPIYYYFVALNTIHFCNIDNF